MRKVHPRLRDMADTSNAPLKNETILLAEDDPDHVLITKRAFVSVRLQNPVQVVSDGVEAIAYLNGDGQYSDRTAFPMPSLFLLDLKMPNKDGFEVLEWIREHPAIGAVLKVVVLTTSDSISDVNRAYQLGAHSFLTKPLDVRDFVQLGPAIKGSWIWNSKPVELVG